MVKNGESDMKKLLMIILVLCAGVGSLYGKSTKGDFCRDDSHCHGYKCLPIDSKEPKCIDLKCGCGSKYKT